MRQAYLLSTAAFWACIAAMATAALLAPGAAPAITPDRVISVEELARHSTPEDCWMAIRGSVYDLTKYLPDHPSRPDVIEPWCGKEATQAYDTKTKGRKHSDAADAMLPSYRIGSLKN